MIDVPDEERVRDEASARCDLYDTNVLAWSEQQAELLRLVASGERINEAVDWPNVIDEIEAIGCEQLRACATSLSRNR